MQYVQRTKDQIIAEYAQSSAATTEHQRAKWGSPEGMINRFRLGLALIDWSTVNRWLDIGCGGGAFFAEAESAGHRFTEIVGLDMTAPMIERARQQSWVNPARFILADFEDHPPAEPGLDLVTLVGVLQQCGSPPDQALPACVAHLRPGGQLFLTTKNLAWDAFTQMGWTPEPSHSWFIYDELAEILTGCGIEITRHGGFLPRQARIVPLAQSHTMFILGRKSP
jgi:2-polyprenyl-3-methyl-5-hydroxy-6-metoxy-1,4-benzoquinol methylase